MKNILSISLFAVIASFVAKPVAAVPSYWAALETTAYTGDTSGGSAAANYSAYYCTVEAANTLFGGSTVSAIESYLQGHFATAQAMATTYDSVAYSDGEYQILDYVSAAFTASDYVAIAFYGNEAYRVYGLESAVLTPNGQLAFNASYAGEGTVGSWQQVGGASPEPSGALLLLLGMATLALKRRVRSAGENDSGAGARSTHRGYAAS